MIPKKILNPKNIVFFYYFVWYVFAPLITSRSGQGIWMHKNVINKAFLMCFMTYSIAMIVLDISIGFTEKHEIFNDTSEIRCSFFYTVIHWGIYLLGFIIYILRTGGLSRWLGDSNTYFYRRGVGQYYLLYSLALTILTFFEGQIRTGKKSVRICRRTLFFIFLLLNSSFIGSRGAMLILLLMLFCESIFKENLISKRTILLCGGGILVFIISMYMRLGDWKFVFSYIPYYFNTFELFGQLILDYSPGWMQTIFMPFLWPFIKAGIISSNHFYDMSVWLTTKYFPNSWEVDQGTQQWNIESDLYLSFHYYWGIPLLILYFVIIAILYKKAFNKGGIWKLVYVNEAIYILSHLRGGVFIYWYWYLIPLYVWLIMRYDKHAKYHFV